MKIIQKYIRLKRLDFIVKHSYFLMIPIFACYKKVMVKIVVTTSVQKIYFYIILGDIHCSFWDSFMNRYTKLRKQ